MQGTSAFWLLVLFALVAGLAVWLTHHLEQKKRAAMAAEAQRLGLTFAPGMDRLLAGKFQLLDRLEKGANRYAQYVFSGAYGGSQCRAFEYHYETYTHSKNGRTTHHHYLRVFAAQLAGSFPELLVAREGFLSKVAQAFGYDDIDLESHEFSRKYCVRSPDKKFAYDVCNPQMMEFLLAHDHLEFELEGSVLAVIRSGRLRVQDVEPGLTSVTQVAARLPKYLFDAGSAHA